MKDEIIGYPAFWLQHVFNCNNNNIGNILQKKLTRVSLLPQLSIINLETKIKILQLYL